MVGDYYSVRYSKVNLYIWLARCPPAVVEGAVSSTQFALRVMSRQAVDDVDDDSSDGYSLLGKGGTKPATARWPWVLLGVFLGLLAVLFVPAGGSAALAVAPASGASGETSCGAVPSPPPPFVRRRLNGKVRNVLVTGAAGFIGSHFALALLDRKGYNLSLIHI